MSASPRWQLPEQAAGWVTDGGLETDLIFHRGLDLPDFASFPLLDDADGRAVLADYYRAYADVAAVAGAGLLLETPTWRANADWGTRLGYDAEALRRVNRGAVDFLRDLASDVDVADVRVVGVLGPRGDGYLAGGLDADAYADYHRPQLAAFAEAGISFTVETDGRLPDGTALGEAVEALDAATGTGAAHLLVNCAHPDHVVSGLDPDAPWTGRIAGLRVNSSRRSHAELDEAEELDEGDLADLARTTRALAAALPSVRIVGGCCGTDARHVAAMWDGWTPAGP